MTPHLSATSSPATMSLITDASYKSLSGAFRSTPTGKLLQAWTNLSESEASPLRTGNLPSGAILKV